MNRNTTRIHNKFEFWSVADCDCKWCQFYKGKNRPCPRDVCCCADIKEEAIKREQAAADAHMCGVFVSGYVADDADKPDSKYTLVVSSEGGVV